MKTYLRHRIVNLVDVKELMALEYLDFLGKYADYVESHAFWEMCYAERGHLLCQIGDREFALAEGSLAFVPPGAKHRYLSDAGNQNRAFVVCFECLSPALKILGGNVFPLSSEQREIVSKIIEETQKTFRMNDRELLDIVEHPNLGGQQVILLHLEYLLISLLRGVSSHENAEVIFLDDEDFYANLVKIVTDYFSEHISERLTLDEICRKVNYSKSFLCKTFKEQTGESLFTCFNRLKIAEAKRLLGETNLSAAKISKLIGLTDAKYFNTLFKKYTGTTPVQFRSRLAERIPSQSPPSPQSAKPREGAFPFYRS